MPKKFEPKHFAKQIRNDPSNYQKRSTLYPHSAPIHKKLKMQEPVAIDLDNQLLWLQYNKLRLQLRAMITLCIMLSVFLILLSVAFLESLK